MFHLKKKFPLYTPFGFLLRTIPQEWKWLILNAFLYELGSTFFLVSTYLIGSIIDIFTHIDESGMRHNAYVTGIFFLLALFGHEIAYRLGHMIEVTMHTRIRRDVKKNLSSHLLNLSFGYFADRFGGEIAHKVAIIANTYERMLIILTGEFLSNPVTILVSSFILFSVHPALGIILLVWAILFFFGLIPFTTRIAKKANIYADEESKTAGTLVDTFSNITSVKVYGIGDVSRKNIFSQIRKECDSYSKLEWWSVFTYHYEGMSVILLSGMLIGTAFWFFLQGMITVGDFVIVTGINARLFGAFWTFGHDIADFVRRKGECSQGLSDILLEPAIQDGGEVFTHTKGGIEIDFRNVDFYYLSDNPILENFSLHIPAGKKIGIVGLSGAGKTTCANLLLRFYDIQNGVISLNGKDIRNFTQESLRKNIGFLSQDTMLFHWSIFENIKYGKISASRQEIENAARLAHAHEFIQSLPHGYETVVGERGVKLSGGQRQRIAMARAILANRPVLVLDEATSALDSESESVIQEALKKVMEGKTVIAIAHRLSTLLSMDRIVVMHDGSIVEEGTHEELLKKGGIYAGLWKHQIGGFIPEE